VLALTAEGRSNTGICGASPWPRRPCWRLQRLHRPGRLLHGAAWWVRATRWCGSKISRQPGPVGPGGQR